MLAADNVPPQVTLVARPGRAEVAELVAAGAGPGRWSPYAAVLPGGDPGAIPAVREGRAGVQDEGSQLVALALAAARWPAPTSAGWTSAPARAGRRRCSAAMAEGRGAALLAAELAPHRAVPGAARGRRGDRGRRRGRRPGPGLAGRAASTGCWSTLRAPAWARCAGGPRRAGGGSRRTSPGSPALQRDLLSSALDAVRPGGLVAYVDLLAAPGRDPHGGRRRAAPEAPASSELDARPLLAGVPDLGAGPAVQLWPHRHGTDAMYLALLRRAAP